ncbi:uncharacterized protein K444DRAFT_69002 [Hyaloscypha bicolor E]|uniref:Uncharacterized protein n=1 Tax=Hyaloscypha bicolor E TaxID=1095630 RepID=A0A2J6T0P8_9HELO|nr:uncharacterized protein K444DRAFT_69002 [Hyaloscypha bicolor E]PMD56586.1 hypothetical protein K444DRAFT_69002 [Hyaloscypha bicolor E]
MRPSSSFPPQYRHRQRKTRLGGQTLAQTSLRVLFTSSAPHSCSTFAFQPLHSSILILKVDSAFRRRAVPHPDISSAWRLSSCPASHYRRSAPAPAAFFLNADPKPEAVVRLTVELERNSHKYLYGSSPTSALRESTVIHWALSFVFAPATEAIL